MTSKVAVDSKAAITQSRRQVSRTASQAPRAIEAILLLVVCGMPLWLGGVFRSSIVVASLLSCVAAIILSLRRRALGRAVEIPWYGWVLFVATLYTFVQQIPMPLWLLKRIAPATVDVLQVAFSSSGTMPSWHPISLDPIATHWEFVKMGTYSLLFVIAANVFHRRQARFRMVAGFVGVGVAVTLLGFIGTVVAPGKPLLVYAPLQGPAPSLIATSFVNPNHGAAFLNLCAILGLALAMAARSSVGRAFAFASAIITGLGACLTLSRGGIVSLGISFFAFAVVTILRRSRNEEARFRGRLGWVVPSVMGAIFILAYWLAKSSIHGQMATLAKISRSNLDKFSFLSSGFAMVKDHAWLGAGRGAFLTSFTRYADAGVPMGTTYSHLENQYLHLPAEWGILVGGGLIFATALAFGQWATRAQQSPIFSAVVAGLAGLAAHNAVDYNLERLGLAIPAAVFAGLLASSKVHKRRSGTNKHSSSSPISPQLGTCSRHWRLVSAFSMGLASLTCWYGWSNQPSARTDGAQLSEMSEKNNEYKDLKDKAAGAIQRHPADYFPHYLVARQAAIEKNPIAIKWFNQALFLAPRNPEVHFAAAWALNNLGWRRAALLEGQLALRYGAQLREILDWGLPLVSDVQDAMRLLPAKPDTLAVAAYYIHDKGRHRIAVDMVRLAVEKWNDNDNVASAAVQILLSRSLPKEALPIAQRLADRSPNLPYLLLLSKVHRAFRTQDAYRRAIAILERTSERFSGELAVDFMRAEIYEELQKFEEAQKTLKKILLSAADDKVVAKAHLMLADIFRAQRRFHQANQEAKQARASSNNAL